MKILKANKEECYRITAEIIADSIEALEKDNIVLGIPGGRNVTKIFQKLITMNINWKKVHVFMVDERMVKVDDDESNFKIVKEHLIEKLNGKLPAENVHPFIVNEGIEVYEKEIKKYGGKYDIVLLSSGEDGHIGALYPKHHSIKDESEYFITMNDSPKMPENRMSLSRKLLLRSKVAVLLFIGEGKKEAFEKFNDDSIEYEECPTKLVKKLSETFIITNLNLTGGKK